MPHQRVCFMTAVSESVFTIMALYLCYKKTLCCTLQRFKAGTLSAKVQPWKEKPQHKNITVLKVRDAKERLLRNTCIRVYPHAAPQILSAPLLLLYLCDWVSQMQHHSFCSCSFAPREKWNPQGVTWKKYLHPLWTFLLFQCCDVAKVGYIVALFISHRPQPPVELF